MPPVKRRGPYNKHLKDPNIALAPTTARLGRKEYERKAEHQIVQCDVNNFNHANIVRSQDYVQSETNSSASEADSSLGQESSDPEQSNYDESTDLSNFEAHGSASPAGSLVSNISSLGTLGQSSYWSRSESVALNTHDGGEATSESSEGSDSKDDRSVASSMNINPFHAEVLQKLREEPHKAHDQVQGNQHNYQGLVNVKDIRYPLYVGAQISKEESDLLILSFVVRWGLEEKGIEDLLCLIDCHMPLALLGSNHTFLKKFHTLPSMKLRYICPTCSRPLPSDIENVDCDCGHHYILKDVQERGNYFVQLSISEQVSKIMSNIDLVNQMRRECPESDVVSGKVYKRLRDSRIILDNDISLEFNVNGVQPFKFSKKSMYPIQACINELPFHARRENMILCGLYFGDGKPKINTFIKPFVDELKTLHTVGVKCDVAGHTLNIKVHTLISLVDSIARPMLQGIRHFHRKYGCSFCLRRGMRIEKRRGKSRMYVGGTGECHSTQQHIQTLERLHEYNASHRKKSSPLASTSKKNSNQKRSETSAEVLKEVKDDLRQKSGEPGATNKRNSSPSCESSDETLQKIKRKVIHKDVKQGDNKKRKREKKPEIDLQEIDDSGDSTLSQHKKKHNKSGQEMKKNFKIFWQDLSSPESDSSLELHQSKSDTDIFNNIAEQQLREEIQSLKQELALYKNMKSITEGFPNAVEAMNRLWKKFNSCSRCEKNMDHAGKDSKLEDSVCAQNPQLSLTASKLGFSPSAIYSGTDKQEDDSPQPSCSCEEKQVSEVERFHVPQIKNSMATISSQNQSLTLQNEVNTLKDVIYFGSKAVKKSHVKSARHQKVGILAAELTSLIFTPEEMALSTLKGRKSNARKSSGFKKQTLDEAKVSDIISYIAKEFGRQDVAEEVMKSIGFKLNNFTKTEEGRRILRESNQATTTPQQPNSIGAEQEHHDANNDL